MNNGMKLTLGILAGAAAGFCLGVFTAPDKGINSRKKLANAAGDWMEKVKHLYSADGHAEVANVRHNGTGRATRTSSRQKHPRKKS